KFRAKWAELHCVERRKYASLRTRRASLNWQGSGLEIHRAARPLGVRIPRPPPTYDTSRNAGGRHWAGFGRERSFDASECGPLVLFLDDVVALIDRVGDV